jgi:alpha-D-xyloside xylohydrolase
VNGPARLAGAASVSAAAQAMTIEYNVGAAQVVAQLSFPHDGVLRYEVLDWGGVAPLASAVAGATVGDEHFYGFGEKFNTLDQLGHHIDVLTFDDPGTKGDHSYKVAPWFVSTRGYGFHLDSSAESTFDMAAGGPGRFVVTNQFSTLAFNLVYGPALTDVITRYTGYTGRPALPPSAAVGVWSVDLIRRLAHRWGGALRGHAVPGP